MREQLGCEITASEVKTVSGKKAMWMVATGKGTGGTLTGQGDVDTTTHWVAVPREKDIVVLLLTCPITVGSVEDCPGVLPARSLESVIDSCLSAFFGPRSGLVLRNPGRLVLLFRVFSLSS